MKPPRTLATLICICLAPAATSLAATVQVDSTIEHQTIDGFGATHIKFVSGTDDLLGALRPQVLDAIYNQVRINLGNLGVGVYESPAAATDAWGERANDDSDPMFFEPAGWNWTSMAMAKQKVIDLSAPAFADYYLGARASTRWEMTWATPIRAVDYDLYIDELAEHVVAAPRQWRTAYGEVPALLMPMNEPLSGNKELSGATTQEVIDLVKRVGDRLRDEGFAEMKLVVPGEETEESSLSLATAILSDPAAAPYVGVIAYHTYPYGSVYADVARILATSGSGAPNPGRIAVRQQLRDLAASYGVPVWMTEVSHGAVDPRSFDSLRARAIHIHDEFLYADAGGYFGMTNGWDMESQRSHFGNDNLYSGDNEGVIVLVNQDTGEVDITGIGHAIGHHARWISPGATVRIEATTDEPLLLVTAHHDQAQQRIVLVLINNDAVDVDVDVNIAGSSLTGGLTGEQSTNGAPWQVLTPFAPASPTSFSITLPALSVTTVAGSLDCTAGNPPDDLGNSLHFARAGVGGDEIDARWDADPLATTYNVYRWTGKQEPLPALPFLTGIAPARTVLPADTPATGQFRSYRVTGLGCAGDEGP